MIRVVTIAGEYGSGGTEIAERAGRLGWRVLDRQIIEEISKTAGVDPAIAAGCDERIDSVIHRLVRSVWHSGLEAGIAAPAGWSAFDSDRMAQLTRGVILHAARLGDCIIVGRGGQCLLQNEPTALHVLIYAPYGHRLRWVKRRLSPEQDPVAVLAAKDHERVSYVRRHFDSDYFDRHLYHLLVSACIGEDSVAELIADAVRAGSKD